MAKPIFNKRSVKKCEICLHASFSETAEKLICEKKGLVARDGKCMRFKYDPLKRTPQKTFVIGGVKPEDFEL